MPNMTSLQGIKNTFVDHPRRATAGTLLAVVVAAVAVALIVNLATKGQLLQFIVQSWTTTTGKGLLLGGTSGVGILGLAAIYTAPLFIGKTQATEKGAPTSEKAVVGIICALKTPKEIYAEFLNLPSVARADQRRLCAMACSTDHYSKNRYEDVLPYDSNRYQMQTSALQTATPYINASPVLNGRRYILTQGPKPNTIRDFWNMVWDSESSCIVMATPLYEMSDGKAIVKCDRYWPMTKAITTESGMTIRRTEDTLAHRKFVLTYGDETRTITQLRLEEWKDHSDFSIEDVHASFLLADKHKGEGPIIAHCSAGVGRSGTWVAMHYLYELNKQLKAGGKTEEISISDLVSRLRSQEEGRDRVIQKPEQYQMIYDYAALLQRMNAE